MTEHRLAQAGEASGKESAEKAEDGGQGAPLMRLRGVTREFPAGDGPVAVLKDVNLTIRAGEMVAISVLFRGIADRLRAEGHPCRLCEGEEDALSALGSLLPAPPGTR